METLGRLSTGILISAGLTFGEILSTVTNITTSLRLILICLKEA